ncbi:uncharacterized protein K452DRAFT_218241 [Aplosporella prunicola CBS 121167]|uniref:FAD/NAD(P)-binding domain-containing protein n=1 Tax=Aplosporella prunicola CBS 121167 TaxID=1176127 RepID=A0A6A6BSI5_9PEZI|nr:uncharacterized protein K452DRAFT_218241 [Aplosporella prunicola CBS 121167]KAF2146960.1 hypothetical protein K452DRAFT_218241 [Aplosporella prunicola CBS 121167]
MPSSESSDAAQEHPPAVNGAKVHKISEWDPQHPPLELEEHPIDEPKGIKVAVLGAGLSGVIAGALLPAKVPGIDLTIFEKNSDVGGTWFENIYPGVRCDVPANVYQTSFEPNTQWTEEFATGGEIKAYWQHVARKYGVYERTKFNSLIHRADWDPAAATWKLQIEDVNEKKVTEETFDFVITAVGHFNFWKLPEYPGIENYKGHLRHSSNWDPNFDPKDKTVAVIGNGASGIQVVPEVQKVAKHLDHYARGRTWIAGSLGGRDRKAEPMYFAPEQLKEFEDPEKYLKYRRTLEETYWRRFAAVLKNTEENEKARKEFTTLMAARLKDKPELLDEILPDFSPHCRRLTPGPGYLEALTKENVSFISTRIKRFTEDGIETVDGVHRPVEAVICSTGANIDFAPPFPIVANGVDLSQAWKKDGEIGYPHTYLGVAAPNFPNLLFIHGPNGTGVAGSVPNSSENQVTFIARLLRKVSKERIRTVAPSQAAADDFLEYADSFFPRTVFSQNCRSWYNGGYPGGRIHGIWPGSASHLNYVRKNPRWEDWDWTYPKKNRFVSYFGNGWTRKEQDPAADVLPFLKDPSTIDLRDHHERWWE